MSRTVVIVIAFAALVGVGVGLTAGLLVGRVSSPAARRTFGPVAASVSVPDLRGLSLSQAAQVLGTVGLKVGPLSARRNSWHPGTVLTQGARPGSFLIKGRKVSLVVSAGSSPQVVQLAGQDRVSVGGSCELIWPPPSPVCVGGPLLVPLTRA